MPRDENMIAALLRERAGYQAHGKTARIEQVNEQLEHYGYTGDEADESTGPQGRTEPPQQTADQGTPQQTGDAGTQVAEPKPPAKKTAAKKTTAAPSTE